MKSMYWKEITVGLALLSLTAVGRADTTGAKFGVAPVKFLSTVDLQKAQSLPPAEGAEAADRKHERMREMLVHRRLPNSLRPAMPGLTIPRVKFSSADVPTKGFFGFDGITNLDQAIAGTGDHFMDNGDIEPPDQGMAVGAGYVVEAVNNGFAVYTETGHVALHTLPMNQFFGLAPVYFQGNYGPFLSDPMVYFDAANARWVVTELMIPVDPTGTFLNEAHILMAVSTTQDPTKTYNVYDINVTLDDVGGSDPLLADQPRLGADANGFFLSANMYSFQGNTPTHSDIFVVPKIDVFGGTGPKAITIAGVPNAFSLSSAITPPGAKFEAAEGGTEYFTSTLFDFSLDNRFQVWAVTNTSSLATGSPQLGLQEVTVVGHEYSYPNAAPQKDGPKYLTAYPEYLDTNDYRITSTCFIPGRLASAFNTAVLDPKGGVRNGVAYVVFTPSFVRHKLKASVHSQAYIAVDGEDILFPSVALNAAGRGVMGITLAGPDNWPSAAYVNLQDPKLTVHVAKRGGAPEDGYSGTNYGVSRWGDYSQAVVDSLGYIWIASEYIPDPRLKPRTKNANWGTFISRINPNTH